LLLRWTSAGGQGIKGLESSLCTILFLPFFDCELHYYYSSFSVTGVIVLCSRSREEKMSERGCGIYVLFMALDSHGGISRHGALPGRKRR
jgi:hypothetical protein